MCIEKCSPKSRFFSDVLDPLKNKEKTLEEIKLDNTIQIHEINIDIQELIKELTWGDIDPQGCLKHTWDRILSPKIQELIKEVNFSRNSSIYQGCLTYSVGKVQDIKEWDYIIRIICGAIYHGREDLKNGEIPYSLRSVGWTNFKKGKNKLPKFIKLLFVFSHNSKIKGYFFARNDWIHYMSKTLSLKYSKQHRSLHYENFIDNTRILYVSDIEDLNEEFRLKVIRLTLDKIPLCILVKYDKFITRLEFLLENSELVDSDGKTRAWIYCDTIM